MLIRSVVVVVTLLVGWLGCVEGSATQDALSVDSTGGYVGVVVALSDALSNANCTLYIQNIKTMFSAASTLMFNATGGRVYLRSVTVAVPDAWTCVEVTTDILDYSWETAHIRVGPSHVLFADTPWTQQPGGCGDPADFIYLSENYVLGNTNQLASGGPTLLHEWAKFRWGVFEEYGHAHDPVYPSAFRFNMTSFYPNYCTNDDLSGTYSGDCGEGASEESCIFTPEPSADITTVTSSLLAAPFLDTVVNFCDNNTHDETAPTKHNLQCDQLSTWEVISQHPDLASASGSGVHQGVEVRAVKATAPRHTTVFLVDHSSTMGNMTSRWEFLRDALRQFLLTQAPTGSRAGVVVFSNIVTVYSNIYELESVTTEIDGNRDLLANMIPQGDPAPSGSTKNLQLAIQRGVESLGGSGGYLVLVTENMKEYTEGGTQNLTGTAGGTPVWPILYPSNEQLSTQVYQNLADISTATSLIEIPHQVDEIIIQGRASYYQAVANLNSLVSSLRQATSNPNVEIASVTCQNKTCHLALSVQNSISYESQFIIEVLHSDSSASSDSINVTLASPEGTTVLRTSTVKSGTVYIASPLQNAVYTVKIKYNDLWLPVVARVLGVLKSGQVSVDVWSPRGLDQLYFSPGVAPRLLATVETSDGRRVVGADVTVVVKFGSITVTIKLSDNGLGADVTGNDGVYSGFLTVYQQDSKVVVSVTATDNNGTAFAMGLSPAALSHGRAPPLTDGEQACCGSQLDLSGLQLEKLNPFSITSPGKNGRVTGTDPGDLPPGRVTDLSSQRVGYEVTLSFTAPGATLNQEIANHFEVTYESPGSSISYITNITAQAVGTSVTTKTIKLPTCDDIYAFTVVAVDASSVRGKASNPVRESVSCSYQPDRFNAGQIAGIVIGCILGLIIILIILYLCCNRDHLDDLWLWRMLTCRCCFKNEKDDDRLYNPPPRSSNNRQSDVIRNNAKTTTSTAVTPIRNISDLYTRPNVEAKRTQQLKNEERQQQQAADDSDDGGFRDQQQKRRNNVAVTSMSGQSVTYSHHHHTNNVDEESSKSSVHSHSTSATIPINQVGLPPPSSYQRDNYGYDTYNDSYGDGYNRSKSDYSTTSNQYHPPLTRPKPRGPPPMPPRSNTQV